MPSKIVRWVFVLVALLANAAAFGYPACTLSSASVEKQVSHLSAKQLNQWMYANKDEVINKLQYCIVTGEKIWLHIANEILTKSQEDGDDELPLAISEALDSNPENVLAEPWAFSLDLICNDGADLYDTPYASYEIAIQHSNARIKKIQAITRPDLQQKVQGCVENLEENQKWIAHLYGVDKTEGKH